MEKRIKLREHRTLRRHVEKLRRLHYKVEREIGRLARSLSRHLVGYLARVCQHGEVKAVQIAVDLSEDEPEAIVSVEFEAETRSPETGWKPSCISWN